MCATRKIQTSHIPSESYSWPRQKLSLKFLQNDHNYHRIHIFNFEQRPFFFVYLFETIWDPLNLAHFQESISQMHSRKKKRSFKPEKSKNFSWILNGKKKPLRDTKCQTFQMTGMFWVWARSMQVLLVKNDLPFLDILKVIIMIEKGNVVDAFIWIYKIGYNKIHVDI